MALDDASGYNGTAAGDGGGGGGGGEEQSKEASPSLSATANGGSGGLGLRSSSKPNAGKRCIVLKSPMGGEPAVYDWPLKKGKGSVRKSEDKHDEAAEIVETIRYVCLDNATVMEAMEEGPNYLQTYDIKSYETMTAITEKYNKAVDKLVESERGSSKRIPWTAPTRVNRPHLKHILTKCYNKSVKDPNELNHYEAFTPEVYGETSFELICQILDHIQPITNENRFVDLGSGVGQVVLQVAALTDCSISVGIEKATIPATYAKDMEKWFRFWMAFYGKSFKPFKLVSGDFLDSDHREDILESTIVFVNNFAFGPEVDQSLKDIFADLKDGTRIFSSKSFCALNFRITARNLSDIGTIMHVSKMDPLKGSVSWTGKPVSYFLHIIDRAKLERYFQKNRKDEESTGTRGRGGRRSRGGLARGDSSLLNSSADNSLQETPVATPPSGLTNGVDAADHVVDSRDVSRASSIERDTEEETTAPAAPAAAAAAIAAGTSAVTLAAGGKRSSRRNGGHILNKKLKVSISKLNNDEEERGAGVGSDQGMAPPKPEIESESSNDASIFDLSAIVSRPIKTTLDARALLQNGQDDLRRVESESLHNPPGRKKKGRPRKVVAPPTTGTHSSGFDRSKLDLLEDVTKKCLEESVDDSSVPTGCVAERINSFNPRSILEHEEMAYVIRTGTTNGTHQTIPHQLQHFLDNMKKQYLSFIDTMQDPAFLARIEADMNAEKKRNAELQKREKQLKAQIDHLITDSLGLLKTRLKELGIQAKTPPEFIEKAKGIVSSHHELQKNKLSLEREIRQLEAERDTLIASKEQELVEKYTKERKDLHPSKIREYVKRELEVATNGMSAVAPLLNKLSDVTFTKCSSSAAMVTSAVSGAGAGGATAAGAGASAAGSCSISEQITTQIRKRPREQIHKQRDWPEKRAKTGSAGDWPSTTSMAKIEENNPEALAKKILEQGRSLEKSSHHRTSAATLTISPTKSSNHKSSFPPHHLGAPGVEVRKIEPPSSSPPPSSSSPFNRHTSKPGDGVHIQPPHPTSRSAGLVVDLPKIDISMSMGVATTSASSVAPGGGGGGGCNGPSLPQLPPPLVLPAHPDSRSQSSDHTDDLTFAKSKMSTTPRAEQFEDRLKSIIHSVLSSDAPDGGSQHPRARGPPPAAHSSHLPSPVPPPPQSQSQPQQPAPPPPPPLPPPAPPAAHSRMAPSSMLPSPSSSSSQQPGPMFSPVKRELPMHLPPPPSTHSHPTGPPQFHHASAAARPPPRSAAPAPPPPPPPPAAHHYPPVSSPYAPAPATSTPYAQPPPPPPSHAHHMKLPPRSSPSQSQHHQPQQPHQQQPHHQQPHHQHQHQHHHHRQSPSSHRTMGDLIAGELERNLPPPQQHIPSSQSRHHPPPPSPPAPPAHNRSSRPYVEPAGGNPREYLPRAEAPTMLRMSQVIEDSIRGHVVKASELEGLACPRTKSPERERERFPPAVPTSSASASSSSLRPPSSRADYPAMEGLAARFGPYMESVNKRDHQRPEHQIPPPPPPPPSSTTSPQHRSLPSGSRGGLPPPPLPPVSSPMSFHDARRPPSSSHSNRPPQPSPLPSPPVLPPKKQHLDDHPDYRLPRDYSSSSSSSVSITAEPSSGKLTAAPSASAPGGRLPSTPPVSITSRPYIPPYPGGPPRMYNTPPVLAYARGGHIQAQQPPPPPPPPHPPSRMPYSEGRPHYAAR